MSCHQRALDRMDERLRIATTDPTSAWAGSVDKLLDQRWDVMHRATEWDAEKWGFDPDRWCEAERVQLGS